MLYVYILHIILYIYNVQNASCEMSRCMHTVQHPEPTTTLLHRAQTHQCALHVYQALRLQLPFRHLNRLDIFLFLFEMLSVKCEWGPFRCHSETEDVCVVLPSLRAVRQLGPVGPLAPIQLLTTLAGAPLRKTFLSSKAAFLLVCVVSDA